MKLWFCTASALLALAASMPLAGQTPDQAPPVFGEQIEVRVVNVEVVVTDKDGNRVTGLQPSDFRLRVDGKDVPVEFFTEVIGRQAVAPEGQAPPAAGPSVVPGPDTTRSWSCAWPRPTIRTTARRSP